MNKKYRYPNVFNYSDRNSKHYYEGFDEYVEMYVKIYFYDDSFNIGMFGEFRWELTGADDDIVSWRIPSKAELAAFELSQL